MGAPYIYDISRLRVKDLHSATYIYVVRRLRVNCEDTKKKMARIPAQNTSTPNPVMQYPYKQNP